MPNAGDDRSAGEPEYPGDSPARRETADGSATLFSERYGQTFHSHHGAVTESRHVFLEGSGVAARLRRGATTRVLEVGFGSGLNFLLSSQLAAEAGAGLYYVALERELLPAALLASLGYVRWAPEPLAALLEFRRGLPERPQPGTYLLETGRTLLELRLGPAQEAEIEVDAYHAIYHDAFSPDANPELWSGAFLERLAAALADGGALVSYTVKGEVRRRLAAAGLEVAKVAGPPGGKREMLRAVKGRFG